MDLIPFAALSELSSIGFGGFGEVSKGKLDVAVKFLYTDSSSSSTLLKEMELMRTCRSPYVVQVLAVCAGKQPNELGLIMEYMAGGSLAKMLKSGPPPWDLVMKVASQVSQGIKFLHSLSPPILHLDLTPGNVLLDKDLNAKLTDFGLSRELCSRSSRILSSNGAGTLAYLPPEAFRPPWKPSAAADIYSLGILLWALVSGKQPYDGAYMPTFQYLIKQGDRPEMEDIDALEAGRQGLDILKNLMVSCWHPEIPERPTAEYCAITTQELYHSHFNPDGLTDLLRQLDVQAVSMEIPRAQPNPTSNNRNLHYSEPVKSQPQPRTRIDTLVGAQFGNHNIMTLNDCDETEPSLMSSAQRHLPLKSQMQQNLPKQ